MPVLKGTGVEVRSVSSRLSPLSNALVGPSVGACGTVDFIAIAAQGVVMQVKADLSYAKPGRGAAPAGAVMTKHCISVRIADRDYSP